MSDSGFNTAYASLDCARVRNKLEETRSDEGKFRKVLIDCFFDGSPAASEAAALFVLRVTDSISRAVAMSDIVKSLPTAIPASNAASLAQVCTFLATAFDEEDCKAPLNAFCYAESNVKLSAVRAALSLIDETVRLDPSRLGKILNRIEYFFAEVLNNGSDTYDRLTTLRGLVRIGSVHPGPARGAIVNFILNLGSRSQSSEFGESSAESEHEYEAFLVSELATVATDNKTLVQIVLRSLVRSLEFSFASCIHSLWVAQHSRLHQVIPSISYEVFLFILTSIASNNACKGKLSACRQALLIVSTVVRDLSARSIQLKDVVSSIIRSNCVAIGSLCCAAGAEDIAADAASIRQILRDELSTSTPMHLIDLQRALHAVYEEAGRWRCSRAALSLGLLRKICCLWNQPKSLAHWFRNGFTGIVQSDGFEDVRDGGESQLVETIFRESSAGGRQKGEKFDDATSRSNPIEDTPPALALANIALTGLGHRHSHVRYCAAVALGKLQSSQAMLFFLPSVIKCLEKETHGAVTAFCLRHIVLSAYLLSHQETAKVVLKTLLSLVRPSPGKDATAAYQTGIVAIAEAAKITPAMATSLLLAEIEKLKNSFALTGAQTKAAACAAILNLAIARPARGTSFVPFVSLCITIESMETSPEATAFCFEAMNVMAEAEVLDPVKAVKIVLKTFPNGLNVHTVARRSYFRLLGSAAKSSGSRKGRVVSEKVIQLLRKSLIDLHPTHVGLQRQNPEEQLSWEQIGQAAESLAQYKSDDVLRIAYAEDEPLADTGEENERLEKIEEECMQLMNMLLSVAAQARAFGSRGVGGLLKLLEVLASHEWKNRQRSNFNPERIAKLRATSEALRRARQAAERVKVKGSGSNSSEAEDDKPIAQFTRAVGTLPTGVIKALCGRCTTSTGSWEKSTTARSNARSIAMRVLLRVQALSPALPWIGLVEDMLRSKESSNDEKASALAVLSRVGDDSFEASLCRAKWFGQDSPLFDGSVRTSQLEAQELFVGMMLHYPSEIRALFQRQRDLLSANTVLVLSDATKELGPDTAGFHAGVEGLLHAICSGRPAEQTDAAMQDEVEARFASLRLARCGYEDVQRLLQPSGKGAFTPRDIVRARLACRTGHFALLREYTTKVLLHGAPGDLADRLGKALGQLGAEQRRAVLYDICGASTDSKETRLLLAAHCLGTAALLPGARASLAAATRVCSADQRAAVARLVAKVCGDA